MGSPPNWLSKLALSVGSTAGVQKRGRIRAYEGGDAYHYSFGVQTNSGTGGKPIVVHDSTTIGYYYEPIVVRASTNTGRPTDLYRLLRPLRE